MAATVLATTFGFLFVHSGRTANPDATGALLIVLTVVALHASVNNPWARVWLGPIFATAFLLRGLGVLMPMAIAIAFEMWRGRTVQRWRPLGAAAVLFAAPVAAWAYARWSYDAFSFLAKLWSGEVERVTMPVETHAGTPLFYLNVLQKYQYEWLICATVAAVFLVRTQSRSRWTSDRQVLSRCPPYVALLVAWSAMTLLVPTLMQTKTTWYLNPFYPAFALGIALVIERAVAKTRSRVLVGVVVVTFLAAEGRIIWNANRLDARYTLQGVIEKERASLAGRQVFCAACTYADTFVLRDVVGARVVEGRTLEAVLAHSEAGDYVVAKSGSYGLRLVGAAGGKALYRRE
jgi:hypothetical protein